MSSPPVTWKVVYVGPSGSGKTTNLRHLERRTPRATRGELTSISPGGEHPGCTFELMTVELARMNARLELYALPGCPACAATRALVLERVDAVVFVADSDPARLAANRQAAFELLAVLHAQGRDPATVPLVVQLNKRELPQAVAAKALLAALRPLGPRASVAAIARLGEGVVPALRILTRELRALSEQSAAPALPGQTAGAPPQRRVSARRALALSGAR
jgi:signal recognition particle receptor subunit beta